MCSRPSFGWGSTRGEQHRWAREGGTAYDFSAQFEGESLNEEIPADEDTTHGLPRPPSAPSPGRRGPKSRSFPLQ